MILSFLILAQNAAMENPLTSRTRVSDEVAKKALRELFDAIIGNRWSRGIDPDVRILLPAGPPGVPALAAGLVGPV